jgi:uncharacterized glyoxalase superfamily protein PhnB
MDDGHVPRLTAVAPMFLVDDVERTAEWYRDHLGFTIGEYFRAEEHDHDHEPSHEHADDAEHADDDAEGAAVTDADGSAEFVILNRDGLRLMLGRTVEAGRGVGSNTEAKEFSSDAYFWVDGIGALFEAARSSGAAFRRELAAQPYGLSEFTVLDCDGRAITFGGP